MGVHFLYSPEAIILDSIHFCVEENFSESMSQNIDFDLRLKPFDICQ